MKKTLRTSHRISCFAFALAVFAALYSIGSLVYGSDPVVTHEYSAPANLVTAAVARDASPQTMSNEPEVVSDEYHEAQIDNDSEEEVHAHEEEWPTDVLAEMAGTRKGVVTEFDPDQPPVTEDNLHAIPTGEYADQILAGDGNTSSFEGEAFGFDPDMEQPDSDNAGVKPKLEFSDQIRQEDIESTAMLSGYTANEEAYIKLQEVDESTAPPTATGASIDPEAQVKLNND